MAPTDSTLENLPWYRQFGPRILVRWPVKMLGTTLGMTVFFVVYFWVLNHPQSPITTMPLVAVDRWIGFHPAALPLYLSLWLYVSLAPALLTDRRELASYGVATIVLSTIGLAIFLLWPTAVPKSDIAWSQHPSFAFLKAVDASGNACPSLHVAFAVFTAVWFERLLRGMRAGVVVRACNGLWCLGILYSTIAVRQHVALDILAGAVLGAIVVTLHLRFIRISIARTTVR